METIYGIQVDTETLREAHEHQKRMQQKLQEQQNSATDTSVSASTKSNLAAPATITRSTSTSALPTRSTNDNSNTDSGANTTGTATPHRVGSTATSPFLSATDHHAGPGQLRSTQSPAFLAKFYEADHRLPGAMASVPWLSLPGAAAASTGSGATENPNTFGRRRSDGGARISGTSTPVGLDLLPHEAISSQQENPFPQPPQLQHHGHHQHLLSPYDLATLSRNNSPMPMNEALPPYLRQKGVEGLHSMERSRSSPGSSILHPAPGSPFILPIAPTSLNVSHGGASGNGSNGAQGHVASPSHLLFAFSGSPHNSRQDVERANSKGVLSINRSRHHHHHSHLGTNIGASASAINLGANSGGGTGGSGQGQGSGASPAAAFFRSSTPMTMPSQLNGHGTTHSGSGGGVTTALGATGFGSTFGHSNDQSFSSSNKEVHA